MINLEQYVNFMVDNYLTQQQLLLLYCLYFRREDLLVKYKERFDISPDTPVIGDTARDELIDRGFLKVVGKGKTIDDYSVTEKFSDVFVSPYTAGNEIWDMYPGKVTRDGKVFTLTLMDVNEFRKIYAERINYDLEEHKQVKLDLQYALDRQQICFGIEKFVRSEYWRKIREERLGTSEQYSTKLKIDENTF